MQHLYVRSNCLIIFDVSVVKVTEMTTTVMIFLQFSDIVGWAAGRAYGIWPVESWVVDLLLMMMI